MKAADRHLVCGTTDTGKSFLVKAELRELMRSHRVHVLDCQDEYGRELGLQRLNAKGLAHQLPRLFERDALAVVPTRHSPGAYAAAFRMMFRTYLSRRWAAMYKRDRTVTVLVLDESHLYNDLVDRELEQLATTGKHQGVALIVIAQRVKAIHPNVRSQCNRVVAFRQAEPLDLKALEQRCGKEFVESVKGLPLHKYIEWPGQSLSGGPEQERSNEATS